jgi:hypothetical protein
LRKIYAMNIQAEKLELMKLLLKTENEILLKKIKAIFNSDEKKESTHIRRSLKTKVTANSPKNGNQGLSFNWEGGLKEMKNDFDGVKLQHHINSLRK